MTALAAQSSNARNRLAKDRLGVWDVTANVVSAAAPLTVIAGGATGAMAIAQQRGVPIAYLATAVILAIFALPYVTMARHLPNAGAFYVYVTAGLGRPMGAAVAFIALLSYNAMQVGLYGGVGYETSKLLNSTFGVDVKWYVGAFVAWLLVAICGLLRIDFNSKLMRVLMAAEIVIALVFAVVMVNHPYNGQLSFASLSPAWLLVPTAGILMVITAAGFVGFENTTVFIEEVRNALKTVPRATGIALAGIGVMYGFVVWTMIVAAGDDNVIARATAETSDLIFNLTGPYLPAFVITLGKMLFITSLFAALLSFHNTANRYAYAMGRDGLLPAAFGRTSQKTQAPVVASLAQSALGFAVIYLYTITGWDPYVKLFFWLTASAALGVLVLMDLTSLGMLAYFTRLRHHQQRGAEVADLTRNQRIPSVARIERVSVWRGQICPIVAALFVTGIIYFAVRFFHLLLGVDPTSPLRWQFPSAVLVAALVGVIVAGILKLTRPDTYARIGADITRTAR